MIAYGVDNVLISHPLLVDSSGRIIVSATDLTTTGGKLKVDSSGRITITADNPSYWQPTGGLATVTNTNLAGGTNTIDLYTIPTSQRAIINVVSLYYVGTVAGLILYLQVDRSGTVYYIDSNKAVVSAKFYPFFVDFVLEAGDKVQCAIGGATAGDDFIGNVFYRRIL